MKQFKFHYRACGKEFVFLIRRMDGIDTNDYQVFMDGEYKGTLRKTVTGWKETGVRKITDRSVAAIGRKIDNYLSGDWKDRVGEEKT